jgi:hypothetical protein
MKINAIRPDFAVSLIFKGDSGIHPVSSGIFIRKLKLKIMQTLTYNKATKQVTLYNSIAANKEHKIETFNNIASINLSNERIWGYNDLNAIVFSVPHVKTNVIYL